MIKQRETMDICGAEFEVRTRDREVISVKSDSNFGSIDLVEGIVYLNGTMSKPIRDNTLIHEWLHGVGQTYGVDFPEIHICAIASELYRKGFRIETKRVTMPPKASGRNRRS